MYTGCRPVKASVHGSSASIAVQGRGIQLGAEPLPFMLMLATTGCCSVLMYAAVSSWLLSLQWSAMAVKHAGVSQSGTS
jgi:hypothetical protein